MAVASNHPVRHSGCLLAAVLLAHGAIALLAQNLLRANDHVPPQPLMVSLIGQASAALSGASRKRSTHTLPDAPAIEPVPPPRALPTVELPPVPTPTPVDASLPIPEPTAIAEPLAPVRAPALAPVADIRPQPQAIEVPPSALSMPVPEPQRASLQPVPVEWQSLPNPTIEPPRAPAPRAEPDPVSQPAQMRAELPRPADTPRFPMPAQVALDPPQPPLAATHGNREDAGFEVRDDAEIPESTDNASIDGDIELSAEIMRAYYLRNPKPDYPRLSRRLKEHGTVLLRVLVDSQGEPLQINLHRSSGYARLDRSALEAVVRWKFAPAKRGEKPVDAWVIVPIKFSLKG